MPERSFEQSAERSARPRAPQNRRVPARGARLPSTAGYMVAAGVLSAALFVGIWWVLRSEGDEAPWIPAGLAAGLVILVAAAAREVVLRRAWQRYTRELDLEMRGESSRGYIKPATRMPSTVQASANALRTLQHRLAEADAAGAPPEAHREAFRLCEQYLASTDEALRATSAADVRAALRAGQERVRLLQKKHLLAWTRGESTRLTQEAQRRVRVSDKIETAQQALEVIGEALGIYPEEVELRASATAVRNFIASVKVGQWVEMAERAAFRGRYVRAIARYRDALFYLSRAEMGDDAREEAANRIQREIELLRARLATEDGGTPLATAQTKRERAKPVAGDAEKPRRSNLEDGDEAAL